MQAASTHTCPNAEQSVTLDEYEQLIEPPPRSVQAPGDSYSSRSVSSRH